MGRPHFLGSFRRWSWRQYFPLIDWFPEYKQQLWANLMHDFIAAIAVTCLIVPQGMSYAILAGVPPINGLYTCTFPLIIFSALSSSRRQVSGSAAIDSVLTFSTIATILGPAVTTAPTSTILALAQSLAIVAGIIQVGFGLLKLGIIANFLSYPVMSGFINGASLSIVVGQLKNVFGLTGLTRHTGLFSTPLTLVSVLKNLGHSNGYAVIISAYSLVLLEGSKLWKKKWYPKQGASSFLKAVKIAADLCTLLVVVIGAVTAKAYVENGIAVRSEGGQGPSGLPGNTSVPKPLIGSYVAIVGSISSAVPVPQLPNLAYEAQSHDSTAFITGAFLLAIVSFLENISLATVQAEKFGYSVSSSQEFIALGASNVISGVFGGHPVGGPVGRTGLSESAGARSLICNAFVGCFVLFVIGALSDAIYYVPIAALGAAISSAVVSSFQFSRYTEAWRMKLYPDLVVMVLTTLLTLLVGVIEGIIIGIALGLLLALIRTAFPNMPELGKLPGTDLFRDVKKFKNAVVYPDIAILRFDADLYFANSGRFREKMVTFARNHSIVILDASLMTSIDLQGVHVLQSVKKAFDRSGKMLLLAGARHKVLKILDDSLLSSDIGRENVFLDTSAALNYALEVQASRRDPVSLLQLETSDEHHHALKVSHLPQSPCESELKHIADAGLAGGYQQARTGNHADGPENRNSSQQLLEATDNGPGALTVQDVHSTRSQPTPQIQTRLPSRSTARRSDDQPGRSNDDIHSEPALHY